jgi:hypothetical protein
MYIEKMNLKMAITSRRLMWVRALFPSWRFFDRPGDEPALFYRIREGADWSDWKDGFPPSHGRGLLALFHNPEGTLRLALHNLLELSLSDVDESNSAADFAGCPSYELLANWVRWRDSAGAALGFEFKISTRTPSGWEDRMISGTHG